MYFLIWQTLVISGKKTLMSAELIRCALNLYIFGSSLGKVQLYQVSSFQDMCDRFQGGRPFCSHPPISDHKHDIYLYGKLSTNKYWANLLFLIKTLMWDGSNKICRPGQSMIFTHYQQETFYFSDVQINRWIHLSSSLWETSLSWDIL